MKRIEAIIRHDIVSDICAALDRSGYHSLTVTAAERKERQKGWVNQLRGMSFPVNFLSKARVEVVAKDEDVDRIVTAIRDACMICDEAEGDILVHPLASVISLRQKGNCGVGL